MCTASTSRIPAALPHPSRRLSAHRLARTRLGTPTMACTALTRDHPAAAVVPAAGRPPARLPAPSAPARASPHLAPRCEREPMRAHLRIHHVRPQPSRVLTALTTPFSQTPPRAAISALCAHAAPCALHTARAASMHQYVPAPPTLAAIRAEKYQPVSADFMRSGGVSRRRMRVPRRRPARRSAQTLCCAGVDGPGVCGRGGALGRAGARPRAGAGRWDGREMASTRRRWPLRTERETLCTWGRVPRAFQRDPRRKMSARFDRFLRFERPNSQKCTSRRRPAPPAATIGTVDSVHSGACALRFLARSGEENIGSFRPIPWLRTRPNSQKRALRDRPASGSPATWGAGVRGPCAVRLVRFSAIRGEKKTVVSTDSMGSNTAKIRKMRVAPPSRPR